MSEDVEPKILERIRKLLAVADRTPNAEEAATFVAQASRLMQEHNVTEEAARRSIDIKLCHETIFEAKLITPIVEAIGACIGEVCFVAVSIGTRFDREEFELAWNAYESLSFDEKSKRGWRHPKRVGVYKTFNVTGRVENVAMARYVFACLKRQFQKSVQAAKPASLSSYAMGLGIGFLRRVREDRAVFGSRSETTGLVTLPKMLIEEAEEHLKSVCGLLDPEPRKPIEYSKDTLAGVRDGKSIELNKPLPGETQHRLLTSKPRLLVDAK